MPSLFKSTMNSRFLPVADKKIIRTDCPANLSDDEVKWLRDNQITTVIDLRGEREYTKVPCRLEQEAGFDYHHMALTIGGFAPKCPEDVGIIYVNSLQDDMLLKSVDLILNAENGVIFFCAEGKDRTGVLAASVLKKYGVDDETIVEDFMQTKENLKEYFAKEEAAHPDDNIMIRVPLEANIRKVLGALNEMIK